MPDVDGVARRSAQLAVVLTSVSVTVSGTPGAVTEALPTLVQMSLRTMPLKVSTLDVLPEDTLEPSPG